MSESILTPSPSAASGNVKSDHQTVAISNSSSRDIPIEQDTIECEDIPNLFEFLLPGDISLYDQFSLSYNKKLFAGWVKQPSPCCGAASVAGTS